MARGSGEASVTAGRAAPPDILRVEGVSKRFVLHPDKSVKERLLNLRRSASRRQEFWALRDIDLVVPAGSTLGVIGQNGSGKTTLLKILGGVLDPTSGTVARRGRLAALLELGAGFPPRSDRTRERPTSTRPSSACPQRETRTIFDRSLSIPASRSSSTRRVKFYSSGMYVRLAFAVAVHVDPRPTAGRRGSRGRRRGVPAQVHEPPSTTSRRRVAPIVFVSHSADQIRELCQSGRRARAGVAGVRRRRWRRPEGDARRAAAVSTGAATDAATDGADGPRARSTGELRPEILVLRGVAVLAILVHHTLGAAPAWRVRGTRRVLRDLGPTS